MIIMIVTIIILIVITMIVIIIILIIVTFVIVIFTIITIIDCIKIILVIIIVIIIIINKFIIIINNSDFFLQICCVFNFFFQTNLERKINEFIVRTDVDLRVLNEKEKFENVRLKSLVSFQMDPQIFFNRKNDFFFYFL